MPAKLCHSQPSLTDPQEPAPQAGLKPQLWPAYCLQPMRRFIHLRSSGRVRLLRGEL